MKTALVIGGTSGLGLEIAQKLLPHYSVIVAGKETPQIKDKNLTYFNLIIEPSRAVLGPKLDELLLSCPAEIDLIVYAAGFIESNKIDELSDEKIELMNYVGLIAPEFLLRRILIKQKKLDGFIAITSTAQWTPRVNEPTYTGAKAGLGHFANSLSLDPRIGKTLVAAPGGMKTPFWNKEKDTSSFLDPAWVAHEIVNTYETMNGYYKFIKMLRHPTKPITETVEERLERS